MKRHLPLLLAFFPCSLPFARGESVDYSREVKPVLARRCYSCHGAGKQKAGLRLDTGASIRRGSGDGAVLHPDAVETSPLLRRLRSADKDERMPPEGAPLSADEIRKIEQWIRQGAPSPADEQPEPDPKEHWAFKPPMRATTRDASNPIDALLSADHKKLGLVAAPQTDREALLRRVSIDLLGLPPTRSELLSFLADTTPQAYERAVDRLLADPRYGERWARHWMDVWRYSDWYGRRMVPDVWNSAPQIWRWRDWIVASLNGDKGYDRMIREMLAGDEIAPDDPAVKVATGFLVRNWYALNPNQWMRDNVEHTGKAFLGLTFNCAHCHDHKYDPLTQEDYFGFRAFFEPLYVRQDRWSGEANPGPFQDYNYSANRAIVRLGMATAFDKDAGAKTWFYRGGDERNRETSKPPAQPAVPAFLSSVPLRIEPLKLPPDVSFPGGKPDFQRADILAAEKEIEASEKAWEASVAKLTEIRRQIAATRAGDASAAELAAAVDDALFKKAIAARHALAARIAADEVKHLGKPGDLAALTKAASIAERELAVATARVTLAKAEQALAVAAADAHAKAATAVTNAKTALAKAEEAVKQPPGDYTSLSPVYPKESTGRRKALAEWITNRANPLTARVAVNHIWLRHFNAPIVASVFDFGRNGRKPTHPELLDSLAVEFMESGWSMKHLHRIMVTSDAYRRISAPDEKSRSDGTAGRDPENVHYWRMNPGRMEAEVVRDSVLFLAGQLDLKMGGQELETKEMPDTARRSLYYACHPEAGGQGEFVALFDAPDANDCYRRTSSIIPQQALALTNSKLVQDRSTPLARIIESQCGAQFTSRQFITAAHEHILSQKPSEAEMIDCEAFLRLQEDTIRQQGVKERRAQPESAARESLVRVLLNHNDFLTVH